jgi:hypothetical protein
LLHSIATSSSSTSSQHVLPFSFLLQPLLLLPAAIRPAGRFTTKPSSITCSCCCLCKPLLQKSNRHSMLQLLRVLLLRMQLVPTQLLQHVRNLRLIRISGMLLLLLLVVAAATAMLLLALLLSPAACSPCTWVHR